jgi:hypothetical protein
MGVVSEDVACEVVAADVVADGAACAKTGRMKKKIIATKLR